MPSLAVSDFNSVACWALRPVPRGPLAMNEHGQSGPLSIDMALHTVLQVTNLSVFKIVPIHELLATQPSLPIGNALMRP